MTIHLQYYGVELGPIIGSLHGENIDPTRYFIYKIQDII